MPMNWTKKRYVKWISDDVYTGPRLMGNIAIRRGDIREVISIGNGRMWLAGYEGHGLFGTVSFLDVIPIEWGD